MRARRIPLTNGLNVESRTIPSEAAQQPGAPDTAPASDWLGVLPAICAVHCLAMPIVASTLPFFAATHAWEGWLLGLSAVLATATLAASWRTHGRWVVWILASVGFAVWAAALAGWSGALPESVVSPVGGLLVAGSLFWNGHLRHKAVCGACACPVHPAGV